MEWWQERAGFFGRFYIEGDNSLEGYRKASQTLKERTRQEVSGIERLLRLHRGQRILDVPCGYGRHSIGLAKRGYDVVGVDLNRTHLAAAKAADNRVHAKVRWIKGDMRHLPFRGEFDAVLNMFFSFGFFTNEKDNVETLRGFYRALKKGGKLLMHTDVNIPRILNGEYKLTEERHLRSKRSLHIHEHFDRRTKRLVGFWEIHDERTIERRNYSVRVYTREEFTKLCRRVGFQQVTAYGEWDGRPYTARSEDMMIVATK